MNLFRAVYWVALWKALGRFKLRVGGLAVDVVVVAPCAFELTCVLVTHCRKGAHKIHLLFATFSNYICLSWNIQ
jgi:hypothetical protein